MLAKVQADPLHGEGGGGALVPHEKKNCPVLSWGMLRYVLVCVNSPCGTGLSIATPLRLPPHKLSHSCPSAAAGNAPCSHLLTYGQGLRGKQLHLLSLPFRPGGQSHIDVAGFRLRVCGKT